MRALASTLGFLFRQGSLAFARAATSDAKYRKGALLPVLVEEGSLLYVSVEWKQILLAVSWIEDLLLA